MGGKSQPAPDYSAMTAATEKGIATAERLGNRQMDFAQRQYEEMKPLAERVYTQQMAAQDQQMKQAQDYYDYQLRTFRPMETGLVSQVQNYNTEGNRAQIAAQAAADAANAFQTSQGVSNREMARRGLNPSSGAGLMLRNQNAINLASMTAGAATNARRQAEGIGFARTMDVTGLGRNLAGASTGAYSAATAAGSTGLTSAMAPGNQYSQAFGQGANYSLEGARLGVQGQGNILNSQTSAFNAGLNAQGEMIGGLVGAGGKLGAAALPFMMGGSDRRLKENIKVVGRDERTKLPLYEFEYRNGTGRRFIGVMADEVEKKFPRMVVTRPDGYKAVNYAGLGIRMLEV